MLVMGCYKKCWSLMSTQVLLNLVHPIFEKSWANQAMLEALRDLDYVKVNDLYEEYPDYFIDIKRERVRSLGSGEFHRGSLFCHQELAIASYLELESAFVANERSFYW